eukprot:6957939-Prymnesium_polylepis.1
MDYNLAQTDALQYIRTGPAMFRECIKVRPVLALGDNGFTQAVIDYAASNLNAGLSYTDERVFEVCRHHVNRCF